MLLSVHHKTSSSSVLTKIGISLETLYFVPNFPIRAFLPRDLYALHSFEIFFHSFIRLPLC